MRTSTKYHTLCECVLLFVLVNYRYFTVNLHSCGATAAALADIIEFVCRAQIALLLNI